MNIFQKIICKLKGHKRGYTGFRTENRKTHWTIGCARCGYEYSYESPMARLVWKEMIAGFDGN